MEANNDDANARSCEYDAPAGNEWVHAGRTALEERRHQMILEALKDIDEGRVVEHDEVERWAANLK